MSFIKLKTGPKQTKHIISLKPANKGDNISSHNDIKSDIINDNSNNNSLPICMRFPNNNVCGCTRPCRKAVMKVKYYEIIKNLYVGCVEGAFNHDKLKSMNVKYILNCSNEKYYQNKKLFTYMVINIKDDLHENIIKYFNKTNKFIDNGLNNKKCAVYVHCKAGISRSVSFIMAYLIYKYNISYNDADKMVGKVHPDALPNSAFRFQLQTFANNILNNNNHKQSNNNDNIVTKIKRKLSLKSNDNNNE